MRKRVAILIHPGRSWGRGLLTGVASFARGHRTWNAFHDERQFTSEIPAWLESWTGDGLLAPIQSDALAEFVVRRGIPTVDLAGSRQIPGVPCVREDYAAAMRLIFDHLTGLGVSRLAYCGFSGFQYSEERERELKRLTDAAGVPLEVLDSRFEHKPRVNAFEGDGMRQQTELLEWLRGLPRPTGVVACNDTRALQVVNAAREAGLRVPDDLLVVGVDNDLLVCELADPPLSSIDLDTVRIGYQAASTLSKMMAGRHTPPPETRLLPAGIVPRQSSDRLAIADPEMASVARFIVENCCEGISVDDVVDAAPYARSTLERRFRRAAGRSIKAEINRARVTRIKELLASTDYTLAKIARSTGFQHAEYMSTLFKKETGATPGEYRREHNPMVR